MLNLSYKLFEIVPLVGDAVLADIFFLITGRLTHADTLLRKNFVMTDAENDFECSVIRMLEMRSFC